MDAAYRSFTIFSSPFINILRDDARTESTIRMPALSKNEVLSRNDFAGSDRIDTNERLR